LTYIHELKENDEISGSEKLNKIVIETREVEYKHWDREAEEEWYSYGTEIVREINASDAGLALWNSWNEDTRKMFVRQLDGKEAVWLPKTLVK
jgi:hypothetical protein